MGKLDHSMAMRPVVAGDERALLDFYDAFSPTDRRHYQPWPFTMAAMGQHVQRVRRGEAIGMVATDDGGAIVGHAFIKNIGVAIVSSGNGDGESTPSRSSGLRGVLGERAAANRVFRAIARRRRWPRFGIGIHHSAQGKGSGEALTRAVMEEAARRGVKQVRLGVHADNRAAIALYEKVGFRVIGKLSQQQANDSYEMELRLG